MALAPLPSPSAQSVRDRTGRIVATATVLALLYLGREVLVPVTLAVILSLLVAPLVRVLRRGGLGHVSSVVAAVAALAAGLLAAAAALGFQISRMIAVLPQYESRLRAKLAALDGIAPMPAPGVQQLGQRVLGSLWTPLESAAVVLALLVFVLLEREAVRDRFIRLAGVADIRATTLALNDAGARLSRYFVSQFLVNAGVGVAVGLGLFLLGVPQALVWGTLAGLLRFVPYVGIWIAALCAALLAAAVDPGWTTVLSVAGLFGAIELVASQLLEPQLYGHATGLSPLSVVISALFWSWLWGPIGLLVSTPLTLCLVVAGRHIEALRPLEVLLGNSEALTMPQRFYQRALALDSEEIVASARAYLKHNTLADYCDQVLLPAFALGRLDVDAGAITPAQLQRFREVMMAAVAAIAGVEPQRGRRRRRGAVLDPIDPVNIGRVLRQQREQAVGRFQGPLAVPRGSVVLCAGLGSSPDELITELLVRSLRGQQLDARHLTVDNLREPPPADASRDAVGIFFLVSALPGDERERAPEVAGLIRGRFPSAPLVTLFFSNDPAPSPLPPATIPGADRAIASFHEAVQLAQGIQHEHG